MYVYTLLLVLLQLHAHLFRLGVCLYLCPKHAVTLVCSNFQRAYSHTVTSPQTHGHIHLYVHTYIFMYVTLSVCKSKSRSFISYSMFRYVSGAVSSDPNGIAEIVAAPKMSVDLRVQRQCQWHPLSPAIDSIKMSLNFLLYFYLLNIFLLSSD